MVGTPSHEVGTYHILVGILQIFKTNCPTNAQPHQKPVVTRVAFHGVSSHIFGNGISPVSDVLVSVFFGQYY